MLGRVEIDVNDLEVGNIIDEDIIDDGILIISRGMKISDRLRKVLISKREKVHILKEGVSSTNHYNDKIKEKRLLVLNDQKKEQILHNVQNIFENVESKTSVIMAEEASNSLVEEIIGTDGVGINLEALKVSDEYTFKHSVDVAAMAISIGKRLGFDKKQLADIGTAGILHDIGKVKIPNGIINKPGKLTDEEFRVIQKHPVFSYQLLVNYKEVSEEIRRAVLHHHEKFGGGGYPTGISGKDIPLFARILCIVDVYDALRTTRSYHAARTVDDTLEIMYTMFAQFDPDIFIDFLQCLIIYPIGQTVTLNTGEKCQVIDRTDRYPNRPILKSLSTGEVYDLAGDPKCMTLFINNTK